MPTSGRNPHRPLIFFALTAALNQNRKAGQFRCRTDADLQRAGAAARFGSENLRLLSPRSGAIHAHRTSARAKPGHQGRWDAVERGAALVAAFLRGITKTKPLAAGCAVGIQALNRSARQGMHRNLRRAPATREKYRISEPNFAPADIVSQEKYPLLVGVSIRPGARRIANVRPKADA
jgi:hypothetical protein